MLIRRLVLSCTYLTSRHLSTMEPQMTRWGMSAGELEKGLDEMLKKSRALYDGVADLKPNEVNVMGVERSRRD